MRLNRFRQIARNEFGSAREAVWLDDQTELFQVFRAADGPEWRSWHVATRRGGQVTLLGTVGGAEKLAAGNGRWMRRLTAVSPHLSGSQTWEPANGYPGDIDGAWAVTQDSEGRVLRVYQHGNYVYELVRGVPFDDGTVRVKHGLLSWTEGPNGSVRVHDLVARQPVPVSQLALPYYAPLAFRAEGAVWLVAFTDALGGIVHRADDPLNGYRFGAPCWSPDVVVYGAECYLAWATGEGQTTFADATYHLGEDLVPLRVPEPEPVGPLSDPLPEGTWLTLAPFIDGEPSLGPRSNTHAVQHVREERPDGRYVHLVKFGEAFDDRHETWVVDGAGNIHHVLDASNEELSCLTDTRWLSARMQIGLRYALVTGEHRSRFFSRSGVLRKDEPINRRMWVLAAWERYGWGNSGTHKTVAFVYDNTAGFHAHDRFIEIYWFAEGVGWMAWEAHRSSDVYATGAPVFSAASLHDRSEFYTRTGQPISPKLAGIYQPLTPFAPPRSPMKTDFLNLPGSLFDLRWAAFSPAERQRRLALHAQAGHTHVCLLAREDDAASTINLFADHAHARTVLQEIRAAGLKPMLWFLCETPEIARERGVPSWGPVLRDLARAVDDLVDSYCIGLELDENFAPFEIGQLASAVREATAKPIYVHGGQGQSWDAAFYRDNPAIDGLLYQYSHPSLPEGGFLSTAAIVERETKDVVAMLKSVGRPLTFVAWEYALTVRGGYTSEIAELARIAQAHGSQGYGNGAGVLPSPRITASDITAHTAAAKKRVEAAGHVFKTPEEATRDDWAHWNADDRLRALLVTALTAETLKAAFPTADIGLEAYGGPSGTALPGSPERYTFHVLLLGKSGWGVQVLRNGVIPTADFLDLTAPAVNEWQANWRPVVPISGTIVPTPGSPHDAAIRAAYLDLLKREPDPFGLSDYRAKMESGWDIARVRAHIMASEEYRKLNPAPTDPILDAALNYGFWIHHWQACVDAARQWYRDAHKREPAQSDIGHGLWRAVNEPTRWGTLRRAFQDTWPK